MSRVECKRISIKLFLVEFFSCAAVVIFSSFLVRLEDTQLYFRFYYPIYILRPVDLQKINIFGPDTYGIACNVDCIDTDRDVTFWFVSSFINTGSYVPLSYSHRFLIRGLRKFFAWADVSQVRSCIPCRFRNLLVFFEVMRDWLTHFHYFDFYESNFLGGGRSLFC